MPVRKTSILRALLSQTNTVYAIEATVHSPTFQGVYGEIFKVLKPGGVVCFLPFSSFIWRVSLISVPSLVFTNGL